MGECIVLCIQLKEWEHPLGQLDHGSDPWDYFLIEHLLLSFPFAVSVSGNKATEFRVYILLVLNREGREFSFLDDALIIFSSLSHVPTLEQTS